jgi:hypothetical protein
MLVLPLEVAAPETPVDPIKAAIDRGLRRIEQGAVSYTQKRKCFSCHHTGMALFNFTSARKRGFAVEPDKIRHQVDFTLQSFKGQREEIVKGRAVPGGNTMAAYALAALDAADHPADETTQALVRYLLVRQRRDGAWPAIMPRPPSEGSPFTNTALALHTLRKYGPAKDAEVEAAFVRGRDWLLANKPATTEDRMFHLRGLVYAGADREGIATARDALLKEQRTDGSWAQLPERDGDAYATGAVLVALRVAGMLPTDAAYQKGVKYLLGAQKPDGAWLVETRSRPVQTFFDNGDPGGKSQFISFAATGWAVLALLETLPAK